MNLSKNFTLEEMVHSQTATNHSIDNTPNAQQVASMRHLCAAILQPARDALGTIFITSGFRCNDLNTRIGGSKTSQHRDGQAADIKGHDNAVLFRYIKNHCQFDQLIWEFGDNQQPQWVHVSAKLTDNRGQVLQAYKQNGKTYYKVYDGK